MKWSELSLDMKIGCILFKYEGTRGLGRNEIAQFLRERDGSVEIKDMNKSIERHMDLGAIFRDWEITRDETGEKTTTRELLLLDGSARDWFGSLVKSLEKNIDMATLDMRDYHGVSENYE